ncbi:MFS transporter [Devosia ginsengisoli]|uniref:MFS transporter n=1 Tax=Devosia ginsengisoli TaxID=400770 RepID=UPI0026EFD530|nr:MFS transporter [Devosia ginsengisoli]MCR6670128.1 MFS transporter [Devosia ginsengisoli]
MIVLCEGTATGLIIPSLPDLYGRAAGTSDLVLVFGLALGIYAIINMLALPILGSLGDRFGRRPLLVLSLTVVAIDSLVIAYVPVLPVLLAFRAILGLTNSTAATAAAWLADITPTENRTRRFGYLNACYGIGFFIGPLTGGMLAEIWLEAPYILASALALIGLALALRLPARDKAQGEPRPGQAAPLIVNPLRHLVWISAMGLVPTALVYFAVRFSFESPNVLWVIYTSERFGFTFSTIGLTMAMSGLFYAIVQLVLAGPIAARIGAARMALLGFAVDATSMAVLAFTSAGWMIFPLLAPLSFGSIAIPALQSLMSRKVDSTQQGRLQGALSSVVALATVISPLACSALYSATSSSALPGAAWLLPTAVYAVTVPIWLMSRRHTLAAA